MKKTFEPIIIAKDDGLAIPEVGSWAKDKYSLVGRYCDVFTASMKNKWSNLVYIDLFSGSGYSKIKDTKQIIYGSPLISLSIPNKFSKYIFCENDENLSKSLSKRIIRDFPNNDIKIIQGNSNDVVDNILNEIPPYSKNNGVLTFCFADPFSLDLDFKTIESLGKLKIDFLILLALHMDANRNYRNYLEEENNKIELFLGDKNWRRAFIEKNITDNESFVKFLANKYKQNMERLGYNVTETFQQIRSAKKNLPLYYLAFFSKNNMGDKFWKEVIKYSTPQTKLEL